MKEFIREVKQDNPLESNPFFKDILENKISLDSFKYTQYYFYPVVTFFSKPMFMLCSKIDDYNIRWKILENIIDEHGKGSEPENHGSTYKSYLINLGLDYNKIDSEKINHYALEFNNILMRECSENYWVKGAAMIAIMEDLYINISRIIYNFLIENNHLDKDKIIHYKIHEEIDVKHSEDMYGLLSDHWSDNKLNEIIKSGFVEGNDMLLNLFSNLYLDSKQ